MCYLDLIEIAYADHRPRQIKIIDIHHLIEFNTCAGISPLFNYFTLTQLDCLYV